MLGGLIFFGDSSEMELRFHDIILGMDWLSRHLVVLDCLRARVDIAGADGSFYCMHATCSGVDIRAEGFLATILMLKNVGQYEM